MIQLSKDQEVASKMIKEFLKSDATDFTLSGRAGTGKTFVLKHIFEKKGKDKPYIPSGIIGMTVSHQAKINLMKSIPQSITYASAVNLKMSITDTGEIVFVPPKNKYFFSLLRSNKKIIIDECSMFDNEMIALVDKNSPSKVKRIWVGK